MCVRRLGWLIVSTHPGLQRIIGEAGKRNILDHCKWYVGNLFACCQIVRAANRVRESKFRNSKQDGYKAQDNNSNNSHHYDFWSIKGFSQHKQRSDGPCE